MLQAASQEMKDDGLVLKFPIYMKVLMNASILLDPRTGIGRYVERLCQGLHDLCDLDVLLGLGWSRISTQTDVDRISRLGSHPGSPRNSLRQRVRRVPGARPIWRGIQQTAFHKAVRASRPAIYHEPSYLAFRFDGPTVITAHDASWVRHPEAHPADRVKLFDRLFPRSVARADRVIVDSAFVGREMQDLFSVPAQKIRVIHLGVDDRYHPRDESATAAARAPYGLTHGRYVLSVGTLEPRKNLATLLSAFDMLPPALRRHYPLVISGMQGWGDAADFQRFDHLRTEGSLHLTGYVSEAALPRLYAGAALFVYPSLYEGFGLPPLEAMASGVPVIVSDQTAMPEIVADAGCQVPARDVDALALQMRELLEDRTVAAHFGEKAIVRARSFDWQDCVRATLGVYREFAR